ncbi:hypothetical protein BH11PAT2_BH11PAT2_10300 [soil metagenome]
MESDMVLWQVYSGGTVSKRWKIADEWMIAAKGMDPEFKLKGFYTLPKWYRTYPKTAYRSHRLIIEFESDIVLPEEQLL